MAIIEKKPENLELGAENTQKFFDKQGGQTVKILKGMNPMLDEGVKSFHRKMTLASTIAGFFTGDVDLEKETIITNFKNMDRLVAHMRSIVDDLKKNNNPGFIEAKAEITEEMVEELPLVEGLPNALRRNHNEFEVKFINERPEEKDMSFLFTITPVLFEVVGLGDPAGKIKDKLMPTDLLDELVIKLEKQVSSMLENSAGAPYANKKH